MLVIFLDFFNYNFSKSLVLSECAMIVKYKNEDFIMELF